MVCGPGGGSQTELSARWHVFLISFTVSDDITHLENRLQPPRLIKPKFCDGIKPQCLLRNPQAGRDGDPDVISHPLSWHRTTTMGK